MCDGSLTHFHRTVVPEDHVAGDVAILRHHFNLVVIGLPRSINKSFPPTDAVLAARSKLRANFTIVYIKSQWRY